MPNWCEGSIRVKGKRKDIFKFFTEGVGAYESYYINNDWVSKLLPESEWVSIDSYPEGDYIQYLKPDIYVKGTKRAFLNNCTDIYIKNADDDSVIFTAAQIRQAWDFRVENWISISKECNIDIRLYGIEMGGGFVHSIEVNHGELIANEVSDYKDYDEFVWNCPFPWMGG